MTLITSCPACATRFYVSEQQLALHDGDVRCGKCNHVFKAAVEEVPHTPSAPIAENEPEQVSDSSQEELIVFEAPLETLPAISHLPKPEATEPSSFFQAIGLETEVASPNRYSLPRWLLLLSALLLLLMALGQALYYWRTPLVTLWPQIKPELVQACDWLGCKVELPRNAELLAIDDSDLQEDAERQGVIRLRSVLINRAPYAQAYPSLELTLTDIYDKPVLRRNFTPEQYLTPDNKLEAGIAAGGELRLQLALSAGDATVAGYRVYVSYP